MAPAPRPSQIACLQTCAGLEVAEVQAGSVERATTRLEEASSLAMSGPPGAAAAKHTKYIEQSAFNIALRL